MKKENFLYKNKVKLILAILFFKKSRNEMLNLQKVDKIKKSLDFILK